MRVNPSFLHNRAGENLSRTSDNPKKLILIHEGVGFGVYLLLMVITYAINAKIANMGGLSALGQQAIWSTAQAVLELLVLVFMPLWQIGMVFMALKWARGESATSDDLWQGLRRWGAVVRLRLLEMVVFLALAIAIGYTASVLFMMTPLSNDLLEVMAPIMEQMENPLQAELNITPEMMEQFLQKGMPLLVFCGVLYVAAIVFVFYRIRLADYGVMDGKGAFRSIIDSVRYTNRHTLQLAKTDLYFWWFYLVRIVCYLIAVGDVLLDLLGVQLPFSAHIAYFLFYIVGSLIELAVMWQCKAGVETTYALVYTQLEQRK